MSLLRKKCCCVDVPCTLWVRYVCDIDCELLAADNMTLAEVVCGGAGLHPTDWTCEGSQMSRWVKTTIECPGDCDCDGSPCESYGTIGSEWTPDYPSESVIESCCEFCVMDCASLPEKVRIPTLTLEEWVTGYVPWDESDPVPTALVGGWLGRMQKQCNESGPPTEEYFPDATEGTLGTTPTGAPNVFFEFVPGSGTSCYWEIRYVMEGGPIDPVIVWLGRKPGVNPYGVYARVSGTILTPTITVTTP